MTRVLSSSTGNNIHLVPRAGRHFGTPFHPEFKRPHNTHVQPVSWGSNVLAQALPSKHAAVAHFGNYEDEIVWGGDKASRAQNIDTFEPYAGRTAGIMPDGSAVLIPRQYLARARAVMRYQQDLGLIGAMHAVGIPEGGADCAIGRAIVHAESIRPQLDALGIGERIVPVIASHNATTLAARLGRMATEGTIHGMHAANHKGYLLSALRKAGVPVPDGQWFTAPTDRSVITGFVNHVFETQAAERVFFKLSRGASGMGVWSLESAAELIPIFAELPVQYQMRHPRLGIVVDKGIRIDQNPNVTVYIGNSAAEDRIMSMSDQILEKRYPTDEKAMVHVGNISLMPGTYQQYIAPYLARACEVVRQMGFRGVGGFDFAIDLENKLAYILEFNGRFNGNNGAAFIAKQAGPEAVWVAHNAIPVPEHLPLADYVAHLERQGAAYDASRYGVFVTNTGTAGNGKFQIGIRAETHEHAHDLLGRAQWAF